MPNSTGSCYRLAAIHRGPWPLSELERLSFPPIAGAFLRMLAGLPLIGGGLSLIGAPSGVAEPVTRELLDSYRTWLLMEYMYLGSEMYPERRCDFGFNPNNAGGHYHWRTFGQPPAPSPSTRAAIVLSAVGCNWKGARNV